MRDDGGGMPLCGPSSRMLGVRLEGDVTIREGGLVWHGGGGMSVAAGHLLNLPTHRRQPRDGGTGKDPVWKIDVGDLPEALAFRTDSTGRRSHGYVEPSEPMHLDDFQAALASTRFWWERAENGGAVTVAEQNIHDAVASAESLGWLAAYLQGVVDTGFPVPGLIVLLGAWRSRQKQRTTPGVS